ncbi:uncharacterized protein LOC128919370 isoform X2 [Rissa tridactyla]|uniref:uncharacterized protein LOC128919370 isoform X2 n=1 Tax=Rissa tridactyla TaxID=75485 RepID=UPI0023BA471F|nr:uncharacterized protein LOC128919370 isoform X2 [Rissa tridactyla]
MAAERAVGERRRQPPFCVCGGRLRASLPAAEAAEPRPGSRRGFSSAGSSGSLLIWPPLALLPSAEAAVNRRGAWRDVKTKAFACCRGRRDGPKAASFSATASSVSVGKPRARGARCAADSPSFFNKMPLISQRRRIAGISPRAARQRFQGTALSLHQRVEEEWPQPQVGCFTPLFLCVIAIISTSPRDRSAVLSSTSGNPCERGNCESPLALCAPCFQVSCGRAGVGGALPQPAERRRASSYPSAPQPSSDRQVPCATARLIGVLPCRRRSWARRSSRNKGQLAQTTQERPKRWQREEGCASKAWQALLLCPPGRYLPSTS